MSAIKKVAVVGAGLMGSGVVQVTAAAGISVTMIDVKEDIVKKAVSGIEKAVARGFKKAIETKKIDEAGAKAKVDEIVSRIKVTTSTEDGVKDADLVIEAATENLAVKHKIFAGIDKAAPKTSILASNTSSLVIAEIAQAVSRPAQFAGLHFFNPVPVMKLVEVVRGPATDDKTFDSLLAFGKAIGKVPVKCKDTPGFIVNRLLVPNLFEAIRLVERGDASIEDTDTAMMLGAGHPMGPFTLADLVGLDIVKAIGDGWHKKYPTVELFKPSPLLDKLVSEGKLGKKTGQGFYNYNK